MFDAKGQLYLVSEPATGTPSNWNTLGYDNYGQITSQDPHFRTTTTYEYDGSKITRTVNGRNYTSTIDAVGLTTQRTDPGGTISYAYWPDGTLKSTVAPGNISTGMTYDKNGNRLTIDDPSAGTITSTYYGTGQPQSVINADNETTTYYYQADGLPDFYTTPEGTTNYSYNLNNLVSNITSPGGVSRSYTYEKGRLKTVTESIGGISNLVTFEYDSKGRLYRKYFNSTTEYEQYDYDTGSGYLYRIQFTADGATTTVWQLTTMDEYARIRQATIGSASASWTYDSNNMLSQIAAAGVQRYDYSFDVNTGNLNSRGNFLKSKTESFGYDPNNLDRLAKVTGPVNASVSYTPDKNGNILTKSDAGTYAFNETPYAVSEISNHQNISATPQSISYYSYEKVKDITQGTKTAEFVYNADGQRIRMTLKTSGTTTRTRWYFGSSCEREQVGSTVTQYIWIGGDDYTAVAVAMKVGTGNWTVYNIFRDHLGTITHLKAGSTVSEYSFDAWGRRRDKDTWSYTLSGEPALFAGRGFTAHEHLEDFALINMNGRLYDPVVGRFLSPDPYIQAPDFSQNFNRYSYALNNPLKYTDPDGEMFFRWRNEGPAKFSDSKGFYETSGQGDGWTDPSRYRSSNYESFLYPSWGSGNMRYGSPGYGGNGWGAGGIYYDWTSNTFRSVTYGNPAVGWGYATSVASQFGYGYTRQDAYAGSGGIMVYKGSIWKLSSSPSGYAANSGGMPDWASDANTGVNAFMVGNGAKTGLLDYAVRTNYKSARTASQFNKLRPTQQAWRTTNTLGKTGAQYLKYAKGLGYVGAGLTTTYSAVNAGSYYYNGGTDWQVGTKATLDVIMTGAGFLGPIGFGISATYFIVDAAGGFGDFGEY